MLNLEDSVTAVPKIGPKKQQYYNKMGIYTVLDLVTLIPRDYISLSPCDEMKIFEGDKCAVLADVVKKMPVARIRKGMTISKVKCMGEKKVVNLTFFNSEFTAGNLQLNKSYVFYGKVDKSTFTTIEMTSPAVFSKDEQGKLFPVYPLTAGLSQKVINNDVARALSMLESIPEYLPEHILNENSLLDYESACRSLNAPKNLKEAGCAAERIIFDELFVFSIAMERLKKLRSKIKIPKWEIKDTGEFLRSLPFTLTEGQMNSIKDIAEDLKKGSPMNRMIEGDVGSGKTVVASFAAYEAFKNGFQSAVMAPTESLSIQHYETFKKFLSPFGIKCCLLTGKLSVKEAREVKKRIRAGDEDVIIGTHALFSKDVQYKNLGLTVTDEQHRFGVNQRKSLSEKGNNTHSLVMSATPIPRTLSLVLYGDLDLTVIKGLPLGRKPVKTYLVGYDKHKRALNFIKKHVAEGKQAYIVCPLIDESEAIDCISSVKLYESLVKDRSWGIKTALLNGQQSSEEKEKVMEDFKNNRISVLISTTVIEVGIDVPNSVVMLIENAERFGLSQLHQLRGRVGRGKDESFCILLSDSKEEDSLKRLRTLCRSNDGFFIAGEDLKLRGPGDLLGVRQHGNPLFKNADLIKNEELLLKASKLAADFAENDKSLEKIEKRIDMLYDVIGTELN